MRTDLSQAFINAKNSESSEPRTLVVFKFPVAGNVYVSDSQISLGGVTYQALVSDWGTLEDAADPEEENAEIRQQTITLINSGTNPFTDYFLQDFPENVEVDIYQWFVGLEDIDKVLIDRLVVQDPIEFDENSQTVSLDLVSLSLRYDGFVGPALSAGDFDNPKQDDIGKPIPYIVGSPGEVTTLAGNVALETNINGPIVPRTTVINVRDNISSWPSAGNIQIDEEEILYGSRSASSFNVTLRGANGTTAADHTDNSRVIQKTPHKYVVSQGPISQINNVKVAGASPPVGTYTVEPGNNPATVTFNGKPYSIQYSETTDNEEVLFDSTASDNTAIQPFLSYDDKPNTAATINKTYPNLGILQVDQQPDIGQISKVFLTVKHWASKLYVNDRAAVFIGADLLGYLDRPNKNDDITIEAEVDIDHGHDHDTGDFHTHTHDDGSYSAAVSTHEHALVGAGTEVVVPTSTTLPFQVSSPGEDRFADRYLLFSWSDPGGSITSAYLEFIAFQIGTEIEIFEGGQPVAYWNSTFNSINQQVVIPKPIGSIFVRIHGTEVQGPGTYARISKATLHINYATDMEPSRSAVSPYLSRQGFNKNAYNTNKQDDVNDFAGDNRLVAITKESPTKVLETKFDILELLPDPTIVDWAWFKNKKLQISYLGNADDVNLFIADAKFDVAVKKRRRVYSDDVTCEPVAQTINRPNQIIYDMLVNKAGLPAGYIDGDSFNEVNQKYIDNGYFLNGVIQGDQTARDAIKNILRQSRSRLIWNAGKAKLKFREFFVDWEIDKSLTTSDLQLKSISASRQKLGDIENKITLFYNKQWAKDYYRAAELKFDQSSISRNGIREKRDNWNFDLITDQPTAEDLAEFYLSLYSSPSTFYSINTYLSQFEVEKEDKLQVTSSGFNQMVKLPAVVRAVNRIYGSSEASQINIINFIIESLRFLKRSISLQDSVTASDDITVTIGLLLDFAESISAGDEIKFNVESSIEELVSVDESISFVIDFVETFSESISASDSLSFNINLLLQDTVFASESINFTRLLGYGSGGYGIESGYGGVIDLGQRNAEEVGLSEDISIDISSLLSDTVSVADQIYFSDGYGSPKFGGYGTSYGK